MFKINNTRSENPFYGKKELLQLQEALKKKTVTTVLLDHALYSCKTKEEQQLFYILCFSQGDITNRQHYMFNQNKIDSGGEADNKSWMIFLSWLLKSQPDMFIKLMPLMVEYVGLRELITLQVRTEKGTIKNINTWGLLEEIQTKPNVYSAFLKLLASYYNGKPYQQWLFAKQLPLPQRSNRTKVKRKTGEKIGKRDLSPITEKARHNRIKLFSDLSLLLNLEVIDYPKNKKFVGLNEFRKKHNATLESVLFSTKAILSLDKEQFMVWLNNLPSGARFNTRKRLLTTDNKVKEKWSSNLGQWFLEWEKYKLVKQQEQRDIQVKIDSGTATIDEKEKFEKVKKEAKVTTGAKSLFDYLSEFLNSFHSGVGNVDMTTVQSIVDKTEFQVPVLIAVDNSMSMTQPNNIPINTAYLLATLALLKNPHKEAKDMVIRFGSESKLIMAGVETNTYLTNRFMGTVAKTVSTLVDRTKPFHENFNNIAKFLPADMGSTNFRGIPEQFRQWVYQEKDLINYRKEQICQYPVLLVLTDGDFNNAPSVTSSMLEFKHKMLQDFGWEGVVVIWDVSGNTDKWTNFSNMENVICFSGFNISNVNQIFTKIHDLDIIDIYTPLKSIFASNRYDALKKIV